MAMKCKQVLSRLNTFVDGEASAKLAREIGEHLTTCPSCSNQVERIRQVGDMLDRQAVPSLPSEFAIRVMAEAQRRASQVTSRRPVSLRDGCLQWLHDLSMSMRVAACSMVLLAFLMGVLMSKELFLPGNLQSSLSESENLDGFEWFSPTPPASLGSAYLALSSP
jgi:anti-sigma factor RsiW